MNFISKVENGYLQFLRLVFLIVATLALVTAFSLGVSAWFDYHAKPANPSAEVSIDPAAFRLSGKDSASNLSKAQGEHADADTEAKEAARLTDEMFKLIDSSGKKLIGPTYQPNKDNVRTYVEERLAASKTGVDYLEQQIKYLEKIFSRLDVVKKVNGSTEQFRNVLSEAFEQFDTAYQHEQNRIAAAQAAAQEEVAGKRASAIASLSIIGGATGLFIVLVLLLVLFRVDRSIRQLATVQPGN